MHRLGDTGKELDRGTAAAGPVSHAPAAPGEPLAADASGFWVGGSLPADLFG
jgi:hypothetical protein